MSQQLFVLVASEQAVASLPPVLEMARPGDQVVWLESREARQNNWASGACEVLRRYGLKVLEPIPVYDIHDPFAIAQACTPLVQACAAQRLSPNLVLNGGTKLTPLGVVGAFHERTPCVLYGNDRPVELWVFPEAFQRPPKITPYRRHTLDLDDILLVSGHTTLGDKHCFWPAKSPDIHPFGNHFGYKFEAQVARRVFDWLQRNGGYDIVRSAWMNVKVARRNRQREPVAEPHAGGKGKRKRRAQEQEAIAELDILLVLKNAVLLHIECKSGGKSRKDLLARVLTLRQTASLAAQMAVCMPIDTEQIGWRDKYSANARSLEKFKIFFMPFLRTASSLPPHCSVPTLEQSLDSFLAPYRPRHS
jgi:hypothetical protein